ncbi:MAG TPA: hypothetical protein VMZ30_05830 [Pyrinomonadaceae bacterium]|nr:hypothetical protein [Pyrinomonadaceae bacterium]
MVGRKSKAILLAIALGIASFVFLMTSHTRAQKQEHQTRSTMRWENSDDHLRMRVEIEGKAEFTDDYTDVRDISQGGYFRVEQDRDGQSRRYEVRRNAGGQLERTFYLNGAAHPLDQDARTWLSKIVLSAVRQSGIDADKRVQSIMRQRGVNGVLEEIALVSGSYAKRIYFQALIKNGKLPTTALQNVLREVARQITSDYEQAQLLIGVAPELAGKEGAMPAFFEAIGTIKSDYEHKRVLTALLKNTTPTHAALIQTAKSAARISSDYEKASVLIAVAGVYLDNRDLSSAFFQTVQTISSDYEHRRVLSALLKNGKPNDDVLSRVLNSASSISSDYEKATLLIEASNTYAGDARLREGFLQAAQTIKSDYERGRVLSTLMKNKQIG